MHFDLAAASATDTPLRFPGKIIADEAGERLFIADSNHNRIVIAEIDGSLVDVIGSGASGRADGEFSAASFNHPQGMALAGDFLYVADTENHMLRKVDLARRRVTTIAGLGHQAQSWPGIDAKAAAAGNEVLPDRFVGKPHETELNSPWDLLIHGNDLFIAMAGPHQIWKMPLDESEIGVYAGNGREDIVDGPLVPKEPYEAGFCSLRNPADWPPTSNGCTSPIAKGARCVPFLSTLTNVSAPLSAPRTCRPDDCSPSAITTAAAAPCGCNIRWESRSTTARSTSPIPTTTKSRR